MNVLQKIPNKIKQCQQCCVHCGKSYKTRTNLEKHLLLCELLHKRKTTRLVLEEEEDMPIPSQKRMYHLLLELGQKYIKLEEKVEEINKYVVKKKKKINILEWLNANITPNILFDSLQEHIHITYTNVEFLFNNSFYDTLNEIFVNTIYTINEMEHHIFAFIQRNNTFYIYDKVEGNNEWSELTNEKLTRFLNKIQMKISKSFYEWKKLHLQEINDNDKVSILYDKAMIKLMSVEFKQESVLSKIKSIMYSRMKTDIKALVEYEFDF
jgi:hypothetical protein